jgi:integrase
MSDMATVDLPYVQRFKDRHGRVRHYYRRRGAKRLPLPGLPGSAEFMAAYAEALSADPASPEAVRATAAAKRVQPRSMNALILEYYRSQEFIDLEASTKRTYVNMLDRFRAKHGDKGAASVETKHLEAIFQGMAGRPGATRNLRKRLNRVFRLAVRLGWRTDNPVRETEGVRTKSGGFTPWSEDEIAAYRAHWPSGSKERMALELLLCTGQRRSDVRRMGRQHLASGDRISVVQQKGGKRLLIPLHPALRAEIAQHGGDLTFVCTVHGKPYTDAGFTSWFVKRAVMAGVSDRTPHGLRKAAGRRLAEAGCTAKQIAAVLGHSTLSEVERYTRDASQAGLADDAMAHLVEAEARTAVVNPV